jgi:hypothetical protein
MNVTAYITKGYENMSNWAIYENEPNQSQNKPNFKGKKMLLPGKSAHQRARARSTGRLGKTFCTRF